MNFKKQLNPSQLEAVTTINGPVLVIAGAGSGKTRAIEYRVLHLVENNIDPSSILLLTFTRKAAREMLSRAEKHDVRIKYVEGGTFHSFAYKCLKKYSRSLGFSDSFSILDESDSEDIVQRCANLTGFFEKEKRFPKKSTLRNLFSAAVNKELPIRKILEKDYPHFLDYAPQIEKIRKAFIKYKLDKNYLDYDDLLTYLKLLLQNDNIRKSLSEKYRFVMVDEYQDTNPLQGEISYLLAKDNCNIMVVGDDAQSIYGFRGSSHENIMDFPKKFEGCKIIKLEENYRSTQSIMNIANAALENMRNRYSKCLISVREDAGEKPGLVFFKDPYEEAEWIAFKIKELRDNGEDFHHIAILFRSAYISIPIQAELSRRNMPYQVFGGLKFYETAHVKDSISYLRIVRNPKDEIAWNRVLMLIEGIGPKNAERLTSEITAHPSLGEAARAVLKRYGEGFKFSDGIKRLFAALVCASSSKMDIESRYNIVLDHYKPAMKDKFDDWHIRITDLEALKQVFQRYKTLDELLADFAIEPPERGILRVDGRVPDDEKPITLSTIHSAKGLEWSTVFLIGIAEGILPISFSLDYEEDVEEENRLFYVAITRAKNRLFMSLHHEGIRSGITQFNKLSRFVDMQNMLALLDTRAVLNSECGQDCSRIEDDVYAPVPDKNVLLNSLLDNFEFE